MRTDSRRALLALSFLALGACKKEAAAPPPPPRPAVLLFVPKLPRSLVVDTTGTPDAERATLVVPVSADSVARFYRNRLPALGWRIRNDRVALPVIDLYLEGGIVGGSLWVHIESQDTASARYTLIATTPQSRPATDTVRGARPAF